MSLSCVCVSDIH